MTARARGLAGGGDPWFEKQIATEINEGFVLNRARRRPPIIAFQDGKVGLTSLLSTCRPSGFEC
jgi:hypothetical protein